MKDMGGCGPEEGLGDSAKGTLVGYVNQVLRSIKRSNAGILSPCIRLE